MSAIRRGIRALLITGHPDRAETLAHSDLPALIKPFALDDFTRLLKRCVADGAATAPPTSRRG